jgi:membrane protein YdbS with pleckstrin-like domain
MKWTMLILRYVLELAALAAFGVWGWCLVDGPQRLLTAALAVAVAASVWGIFMAPKSTQRLNDPARLATEVAFFIAAGAALWAVGRPWWGAVFAAVAIGNAAVIRRWEGEVVGLMNPG